MKAVDLFCGIGGFSAAINEQVMVTAIDQSSVALQVYRHNFPQHKTVEKNILGLSSDDLEGFDFWWMSPPCQPYTVRGKQRGLEDRRSDSLVHILRLMASLRPRWIGFENVPGFSASTAHDMLCRTLSECGYFYSERTLCPTDLGIPNKRKRFFLVASQDAKPEWGPLTPVGSPFSTYLDPHVDDELRVAQEVFDAYKHAAHVVDPTDAEALCHCITSAYGRSLVRSGSYLRYENEVRRLDPQEILRLHHFPHSFKIPHKISRKKAWTLVGNSLSVACVREVLSAVLPSSTRA
jgi:DNA (cytosine-5)-methyltransferase 1